MLLFHVLIIWLAIQPIPKSSANSDYETDLEYNEEESEIDEIKYLKLCSSLPAWCVCSNPDEDYSSYTLSCFHDDPKDEVEIKIINSENLRTTIVSCKEVLSFKLIPDITDHYGQYKIILINCTVPNNESINQLTRKISKNMNDLVLFFGNKNNLKLDKNDFEGLSFLENLQIDLYETNITNISANYFEHFVNLESLVLDYLPLPNGIFDTLHNLQYLRITSATINLTRNYFKNQRNLVELHLNCSNQCSLSPFVFENLINLEILEIERFQISSQVLANMWNLMEVSILLSGFETFNEDIFKNSTNIVELKLSENNLKSLPKDIFQDQIMLARLALSTNQIVELIDGTFDKTVNLEILLLSHNKLTSISRHLFAKLQRLSHLHLDNNAIKTIEDSFHSLKQLQIIHLRHNQLSNCKMNNLFDNSDELNEIDLSYNNLTDFHISVNTSFYHLIKLDLSHNNISAINHNNWWISVLSNYCKVDFSYNNFTAFNVEDFRKLQRKKNVLMVNEPKMQYNLDGNPIRCDCNALELVQFIKRETKSLEIYNYFEIDPTNLKCQTPNSLYGRLLSNLSTTELFCDIDKDCPKGCKCKQSTYNTIVFECSSSQLQELPTFPQFEIFNPSKTELYAANNQIHSIQLINIPDDLTILDLRNNSLQTLAYDVINRFKIIDKLYLSINPWSCNCDAVEFVNFFHHYRSKIDDADDMMCDDRRPFKALESTKLCVQFSHVIVVFLMVTSLLGLFTIVFMIFKKQIKIWLYAHNCCLWWVSEEDADKDMIYDAFFIFSHHDDNFVTDMIIDLEEKAFKCCVHHRDWMAGEMIVTSALNSIKTSRRIIVVLSPMFIESTWATWEFRVSLIHAFNQKRSRVLVIIYGDVSLIDELDDDLKTYIAYNTYLDSEDKWFDHKLFYAMPHKTVPVVEQRRLTSTRSEDDDISNISNFSIEHIDIESDNLSNSI